MTKWIKQNEKFWTLTSIETGMIFARIYLREGPYYTKYIGHNKAGDFATLGQAIAFDPKSKTRESSDLPWDIPEQ